MVPGLALSEKSLSNIYTLNPEGNKPYVRPFYRQYRVSSRLKTLASPAVHGFWVLAFLLSLIVVLECLVCRALAANNWTTQVNSLMQSRQLTAAETMIVKKLQTRPRDPELITLLAEIRIDQRRYREALHLLQDADDIGGPSAERATFTGLVAVVGGRLDLAEPEFREAIRLNPRYAPAHYYLGRLLYTQNRFNEAIQETKEAISLDPSLVRAYDNLGLCFEAKQQVETAERWYLKAIRWDNLAARPSEWPQLDLASMLIRNGQTKRAKLYVLEALKINPRNAKAHLQMGALLEKTGHLRAALKELLLSVRLDPEQAGAYYRAARIYQRLGNAAQAQREFEAFKRVSEKRHSRF